MNLLRTLLIVVTLCIPGFAHADETAETDGALATTGQLGEWIKQLDSDRFSKRQEASRELSEAGERAIPQLTDTALTASPEAASRCVQILEEHVKGDDESVRAAAKKALRKIADSDKSGASRLAKQALGEIEPEPEIPAQRARQAPAANPFPANGRIQFQIQMRGGGGLRITRRNVNGVKDTNITENDRKIQIHEQPNGKIKIDVTEPNADDKQQTKTYEADSVEDLKKKHADAYRIYKRFAEGNGGVNRIVIPQLVPGNPVPPIGLLPQAEEDAQADHFSNILKGLKDLKASDLNDDQRQALREVIERIQRDLKP